MKNLLWSFSLTLLITAPFATARGAELSGRIVITKKLTKKHVAMPVYALRGASGTNEPPGKEPVSECQNVVLYLEGDLPTDETPVRAELRQQNQRFEPPLLVVPAGSTVSFPNADPIFHNVFSLSGAKKFDLGYYPEGQTRFVKFSEPGVVQVYCHLHSNMYAAIVITPNQWHTKPAEDGTFCIRSIPPGRYRLVAWHMNAGFFRRDVEIPATGSNDVVMNIPVREEPRR